MITADGYSKDPGLVAEGVCITWSKDLINARGGLLAFIRYFEQVMSREDGIWLQKCNNKPTQPISHVYIIICNHVRYKLFYVDHEAGPAKIGTSWSSSSIVHWPRLVLAGPFIKAPRKIIRPGFQGFRYCTKLF